MKLIHSRNRPRGLRPQAWALTRMLRSLLRTLAVTNIFNVRVINRQVVPRTGAVIIACNHISVADPIFLWGALRRNAVAIAMAELWQKRGTGLLMSSLGHIPVLRGDKESGRKALANGELILRHGGMLIIFPEGKCSSDGQLLPFKPGVAQLALATGAQIVPAGIIGSNNVKPLKSARIHPRRPVRLTFGVPIDPVHYDGPDPVADLLAEVRHQLSLLTKK